MPISKQAKGKIEDLVDKIVCSYLSKAEKNPKLDSGNPFVLALLKDFEPLIHNIHGLKTSLGSEMEKIAEIIALDVWGQKNINRKTNRKIILPKNVFQTIDTIINELSNAQRLSNYHEETKRIIASCNKPSKETEQHTYEFDLELYDDKEKHHYFLEMKGPDPNTTEVPGAKKRLMAELAWGYMNKNNENIDAQLAVYYNNKFPAPYKNPKVLYYFDPNGGLIVHEKFWNFLGKDENTYGELLNVFRVYGEKNKKKIWNGFSKLIRI